MSPLELFAASLGAIAVYLTVRQNPWCWPIGLVMVALYAWIFFEVKLYSDMLLQMVYAALQLYGWLPRFPWRQLSQEYVSPQSNHTYLFIYRIPHPELEAWHRGSLLWPLSALGIALVVLTLFSLLLTLSITRPLNRLRRAVHDLGQTAYQKDSLARLARRGDELGTLARDFNRMGERLQSLIGSQRQLLRDVSHELRSPLARLQIGRAHV